MYGSPADDAANTRRVIQAIKRAGWSVYIIPLGERSFRWPERPPITEFGYQENIFRRSPSKMVGIDPTLHAIAAESDDGQPIAQGPTPYIAAVALAEAVGIDLRDG